MWQLLSHKFTGRRKGRAGFTVLELLVAATVLLLLLGMLLSVTTNTTATVKKVSNTVEAFAAARAGFDLISQRLAQATLNTYWDYYDASGARRTNANASGFRPANYGRASDLQFLVRQTTTPGTTAGQEVYFQTPEAFSDNTNYQSTEGLLNVCGYFIRYGNDDSFRPAVVGSQRWRYRLMQALEPTEKLQVYKTAGSTTWADALSSDFTSPYVRPVAENVIALIVWPRLSAGEDKVGNSLTTDYTYDSKAGNYQSKTANQLPPTVQISFIAIDEASASRLDTHSSTPPAEITAALSGKFTNVSNYKNDLDAVAKALSTKRINYRILTTSVVLLESKWSN